MNTSKILFLVLIGFFGSRQAFAWSNGNGVFISDVGYQITPKIRISLAADPAWYSPMAVAYKDKKSSDETMIACFETVEQEPGEAAGLRSFKVRITLVPEVAKALDLKDDRGTVVIESFVAARQGPFGYLVSLVRVVDATNKEVVAVADRGLYTPHLATQASVYSLPKFRCSTETAPPRSQP